MKKDAECYLKVINLSDASAYKVHVPASLVYDDQSNKKTILSELYSKFVNRSLKLPSYAKEVIAGTISPGMNEEYSQPKLRFHLDSPLVYNQVYELDLETHQITKL